MPLRFGGLDLVSLGQEDTPNPGGSPVCLCPSQLRVGFKVSFWEPVRRVDVVRRPFCMTSLGGIELNPGFDAPRGSRYSQDSTATSSFYQVHWYVDPIIFWLEAIFDNACLEQSSFDVAKVGFHPSETYVHNGSGPMNRSGRCVTRAVGSSYSPTHLV